MKSTFNKAKPFLITAGIAILAVYLWNTYAAPKFADGKYAA